MFSSVGIGVIFLFLESIDDVKERMDAADEDSLQVELSVDAL